MKNAVKLSTLFSCLVVLAVMAQPAQAQVLNLSALGSSGEINDALFSRTSLHGQGSGNFEPFVRIQQNGTEQGYNTDGTLEFDTKTGVWTHSIQGNDIPLVNIAGIDYCEILLDAGEPAGGTLQLDVLELYLLNQPDISGYPANFPLAKRIYQLLDVDHNAILLDNLNGNGVSDMFAYVPDSVFKGDQYLYLYSKFSLSGGTFEEWGTQEAESSRAVPEPASLMLLGSGIGMTLLRRKKA